MGELGDVVRELIRSPIGNLEHALPGPEKSAGYTPARYRAGNVSLLIGLYLFSLAVGSLVYFGGGPPQPPVSVETSVQETYQQ